jgi:hypothetical protein
MAGTKRLVYAETLTQARAGSAGTGYPFKFFLTFTGAHGIAAVENGREITAVLDGHEAAAVIGAIPVSLLGDDADRLAVARVSALLHRLADGGPS